MSKPRTPFLYISPHLKPWLFLSAILGAFWLIIIAFVRYFT